MPTELQTKPNAKEHIWKMFDQISPTYDAINRAMTGGLDKIWRKKMGDFLPKLPEIYLLDCATGTADQILTLVKDHPQIIKAEGIDLSTHMLNLGEKKIKAAALEKKISLYEASALDIPFADSSFDCVTMSFGIRNVTCPSSCLQEIFRVLKPSGRLLILESSIPSSPIMKCFHLLYLRKVLPNLGGFISKRKDAYVYLNQTIESFPYGKEFCNLMEINKFENAICHPLMFGAVSIYQADKPKDV
ncbi:MAG: bifunctional demethylmenaquinone methyltransferase/2-methoxy-6-polyprenyl-1,4-benzoquinol methylase UbiE [Chlamydiae bacterium]|nr:bifunctional demethylmenaquinone methyltransferase/2-methoxy-6-polyprenyl-1,4-benzoquinol methylase UbiE [Chlamydiota bacterium]